MIEAPLKGILEEGFCNRAPSRGSIVDSSTRILYKGKPETFT